MEKISLVKPPLFNKSKKSGEPELNKEKIQVIETKLNKKLPKSYIDVLINDQNGGELRKSRVLDLKKGIDLSIYELHGIGGEYDILKQQSNITEWEYPVKDAIYFGSVDGHQAFLFEYADCTLDKPEPVIVRAVSDGDTFVTEVAENFSQFLGMLIDETGSYDWVILPGHTLEEIDHLLSSMFWEKQGVWDGFIHEYKSKKLNANLQLTVNKYSDGSGYSSSEYPECPFTISMSVCKSSTPAAFDNLSKILSNVALHIHSPHPVVIEENEEYYS